MKEINSEVKMINKGLLCYSMAKIKMAMNFQVSKNRRGVIAQNVLLFHACLYVRLGPFFSMAMDLILGSLFQCVRMDF